MLLLRVGQPFYQACLVNELDAPATFARVEKLFFLGTLTTAYATSVWLFKLPLLPLIVRLIGRVIHQVGERGRMGIIPGRALGKLHFAQSTSTRRAYRLQQRQSDIMFGKACSNANRYV
jgi:hypothetical protein